MEIRCKGLSLCYNHIITPRPRGQVRCEPQRFPEAALDPVALDRSANALRRCNAKSRWPRGLKRLPFLGERRSLKRKSLRMKSVALRYNQIIGPPRQAGYRGKHPGYLGGAVSGDLLHIPLKAP